MRRLRIKLIMLAAAVMAAVTAVAGCSPASSGTGRASGTAAGPARIVSLSPTATEDLYAVGAGKQVVAVDETSDYPAGVPKTSLSGISPNVEAIAKYNPGLVIDQGDYNGLAASLKKLGIPVLIEPAATTINGAYSQIEQIGKATGHAAQAARVVASMKARIAADVRKAGTRHSNLSYFWEVSTGPYYTGTSKTLFGQVAALFGLKNVADAADKASDGGYPQVSQEYIVAAKPQLIFLTDNAAGDGGQTPAMVARRPGWKAIPAVSNGEVIGMNDDVASRWGPRLPQLVAAIAGAVRAASAKNPAQG